MSSLIEYGFSSVAFQEIIKSVLGTLVIFRLELGRLNWRPIFDRILDLVAPHCCLCG